MVGRIYKLQISKCKNQFDVNLLLTNRGPVIGLLTWEYKWEMKLRNYNFSSLQEKTAEGNDGTLMMPDH